MLRLDSSVTSDVNMDDKLRENWNEIAVTISSASPPTAPRDQRASSLISSSVHK
jgi:hypothetical protein